MQGRICALLACVLALAATSTAHAADSAPGHLRVAIDSASRSADFTATAGRNRFVILQEWEQAKMQALKAENPSIKVLLYKDLSAMMAADAWGNVSTGVTTQEAAAHPEWYLLNTAGQRFTFGSYGWMYAADVGDPGYQQRWTDDVLAKLQAQGWDGVFADDTNPTIRYHYDVASVAKYPSDATYGAATGSMLAFAGPRIRAAGKLIIPNMGSWRAYRSVVDGWLDSVSGGMDEMFTKWGATAADGYVTGSEWETQLGEMKATEAKGKVFLGVAHSATGDATAARYGWATTLLAGGANSSYALQPDYTNETWFADYDLPLGAPAAAETRDPSGVHRRRFDNGLVLVNPTSAGVSVSFGGSYSGSGLTNASAAVMAPHTALVLTTSAVATPTPAATPTPTASPAPTATPTPSPSPTPTPTATPSPKPKPGNRKPPQAFQSSLGAAASPSSPVLVVRVSCRARASTCHRRILLRIGTRGAPVGRASAVVRGGATRRVAIRLDARGRRALARRGRVTVRVTSDRRAGSGAASVSPSRVTLRAGRAASRSG
jgi:hypothetical protein